MSGNVSSEAEEAADLRPERTTNRRRTSIERQVTILAALEDEEGLNAEDLAALLRTSIATIEDEIAALRAAGMRIFGAPETGYVLDGSVPDEGFLAPSSHDVPHAARLSDAERQAVEMGLAMLIRWDGSGHHDAAARALERMLANDRLREARAAPRLDLSPDMRRKVEMLLAATARTRKVKMTYSDVMGTKSRRRVRPLGLSEKSGLWLLYAWCELRRDYRTFRVDRMSDLKRSGKSFATKKGMTLADFHVARTLREQDRY